MISELYITPQGMLRDSDGVFSTGHGNGLITLIQSEFPEELSGKQYFKKIFTDRIRSLSSAGEPVGRELAGMFELTRPTEQECALQALSVPPLNGAEYFDGSLLLRFHLEFEQALQLRFNAFSGTFAEFIRTLSPAWKHIGKVAFHLAENKGEATGKYPFAFMASFVHRVEGESPKHLPLAASLKAYAGDKRAMSAVLAPIQQAAEKSGLIRNLLESRRIFQPSAWTAQEAYNFLCDIPFFEEANIVVRIVNLWKGKPPKAKVTITLDSGKISRLDANTLLSFSAGVTLNGETLSQEELKALLLSSGGLVRIKGQWVESNPEKIASLLKQWKEVESLASETGISVIDGLRLLAGADLNKGHIHGLGQEEFCEFTASGGLKDILSCLNNPGKVKLPELPNHLENILRPYQADGVKYLWQTSALGLGACLADDMGLGKTLQLLTLLMLWKQSGELAGLPALLVLPATLLSNWKNESEKFTPDLKITVLHASAMSKEQWDELQTDPAAYLAQFELALVTYGMLLRLPELVKLEFPAVIADEAQAIKNPASKQSRAVRALRGKRRIALTGTPVENRLADLWSIFDFVNPGLLGNLKSFLAFTKKLNEDYTPLRKLTQPFILRRLKTDKRIISDLPDKTELKVYCGLSGKQAALYAHSVEEMTQALAEETEGIKRRGIVLSYLMRFKQICNHPAQFLGTGDFSAEAAGKFLRIAELVESIASRQEKVLVFTQFREMTEPLHDHLRNCFGREGLILHGGTPVKERAKLVMAFQQDDGPPFFVLSLKAAGVGLNLTAANHVIHFDRWWNPAVENQASDRAYRIGQKRNVLIHKFICKGTLEEKIDALMTDKQNLADELLSGGAEKLLTDMSNAELLDLVKLNINSMEI